MTNKGFTLIELAIVLVIIGILMGAILRGQELIKSAKEKKFFIQLEYLAQAQFTYLQRMGRYAGDTDPSDGFIDNSNIAWTELENQHLVRNKDKKGAFPGVSFDFGNGWCAQFGGNDDPTSHHGNYIYATNVPQWVAESIDHRIDDGHAPYGYVRWSPGGNPCGDGSDYDSSSPDKPGTLYWFFDL